MPTVRSIRASTGAVGGTDGITPALTTPFASGPPSESSRRKGHRRTLLRAMSSSITGPSYRPLSKAKTTCGWHTVRTRRPARLVTPAVLRSMDISRLRLRAWCRWPWTGSAGGTHAGTGPRHSCATISATPAAQLVLSRTITTACSPSPSRCFCTTPTATVSRIRTNPTGSNCCNPKHLGWLRLTGTVPNQAEAILATAWPELW